MGISDRGENALALQIPDSASIRLAFTEELPMSYPSRYIILVYELIVRIVQ